MLYLSGSKELDVVSMDPGDVVDSPPHTPAYEELIEVITCAVASQETRSVSEKPA